MTGKKLEEHFLWSIDEVLGHVLPQNKLLFAAAVVVVAVVVAIALKKKKNTKWNPFYLSDWRNALSKQNFLSIIFQQGVFFNRVIVKFLLHSPVGSKSQLFGRRTASSSLVKLGLLRGGKKQEQS